VGYPFANADGDWREDHSAIRLDRDLECDELESGELKCDELEYTAAHEAFHAASQSPEQHNVEHGLVYAMTAIWTESSDDWHYKGTPVTDNDASYSLVGEVTANATYRVFQKVGKNKAFKFVLGVDLETPINIDKLAEAMMKVGKILEIENEVEDALKAAGLPPPPPPPVFVPPNITSSCFAEQQDNGDADIEASYTITPNDGWPGPVQIRIQSSTGATYNDTVLGLSGTHHYTASMPNPGITFNVHFTFPYTLPHGGSGETGDSCYIGYVLQSLEVAEEEDRETERTAGM